MTASTWRTRLLTHSILNCRWSSGPNREEDATPRSFGEFDYLLGVRDDLRQGAVRFRANDSDSAFLATDQVGVPLLTELPVLLGAAGHRKVPKSFVGSLECDGVGEDRARPRQS